MHRKGITAKATGREDKRRHEARENGIILEKAVKMKKERNTERALDRPAVGKFRGGMLRLGQHDVRSIHGSNGAQRGRKDRR
jgi:hypothetical protein